MDDEKLNSYHQSRRFYSAIAIKFPIRFWLSDFHNGQYNTQSIDQPQLKIQLTGIKPHQKCMNDEATDGAAVQQASEVSLKIKI